MTSLINNPLFSGISAEVLSDDLKDVNYHTKVYRKGDILARQGDICNRLVILTKGSVRGEMIDDSGRLIKVEDITAPRAIAPLFLFGNENRYPVEVTANEATEVIEIPKTSVLMLFKKNERFLAKLLNLSANYAHTLSDKLFFMSFKIDPTKVSFISASSVRTTTKRTNYPRSFSTTAKRLFRSITPFTGTRTGSYARRPVNYG